VADWLAPPGREPGVRLAQRYDEATGDSEACVCAVASPAHREPALATEAETPMVHVELLRCGRSGTAVPRSLASAAGVSES